MKNLTLSIQREFFEEIINGTKTKEYREIKPTVKHWYLDENDEIKNYDTITLYTGQFKGKRPGIVIECKGATLSKGKKYITYKLGEILEKLNFENLKPVKELTPYQSFVDPKKHAGIDEKHQKINAQLRLSQKEKNAKYNSLLKRDKINQNPNHPILDKHKTQ